MKKLFGILLLLGVIHAEFALQKFDKNNNKIFELLADKVYQEGGKVVAQGNAVMLNNDLYVIANKIIYDREKRQAEIEGDIKIYKGGSLFARSEKVKLNLNEDYGIIEPFYIQDTASGMWVNAKFAASNKKIYTFKKAVVSGCGIERPVWHMDVSSGTFNSEKSVLSVWNPTLYIGSVPVFYLPYLRVSTLNERSSGFLYPQFAFSNREGFIYVQPFYIAPQKFWDLTITPQIRTQRGFGGDVEFRIVDKTNSMFYFKVGYLYNFQQYIKQFNLRNKQVFGFQFSHANENPFQKYFGLKNSLDNGLYIDFLYMNDLDYLRLERFNARIMDGTRVSRMNFYVQTDNQYFGLNFRYFINLNKINNSTTFQTLPQLQYHKYLNSLYFKGLLYSIDYNFRNIYRPLGYGYIENSLKVPIGMQFSLFHKYVSLGIWNNFYASNLVADNTSKTYFNRDISSRNFGNFVSANLNLTLNMDLAKDYDKVFHVVEFFTDFSLPYFRYSDGLLDKRYFVPTNEYAPYYNPATGQYTIANRVYDAIWNPSTLGDYATNTRSVNFRMSNYFYGLGGKNLFYWRLSETLNFDDKIAFYRSPLENKIGFSPITGLNLSAIFSYSFYYRQFQEISINATYSRKYMVSSLTYYIKSQFSDMARFNQASSSANYLTFSFSNDFGYFGLNAYASFNFNNLRRARDYSSVITNWSIGIFKNIRCFGFGLRVASQRVPILTNDTTSGGYASSVFNNTYVKFDFSFAPLTRTGLTYRFYNK
ncbi:LPS-assembly protein LptD [Helicobacter mustelae]|uniref:Putative organic solvent tolerance protein n=1 Tax=Helicobacter mustelae (strain ATCC 43772 / CCUG 25715 / CIP 103759 / LMG 18044 / NCTC 12198 / R85-136P) TaxID=679897 RepID=D3UHN1_HELM1|nr:LPS assembly protein LptD [Helicobacter mustelae]CBG40003.1 putative organic solvent tolerance protein [Helicobacter mustelae 12198]SQH71515.1 organic solvent tolerance protein [Helicobacter mustelae]STP12640.1 organic solvent tolerance protein [Helicobacter mustelae]